MAMWRLIADDFGRGGSWALRENSTVHWRQNTPPVYRFMAMWRLIADNFGLGGCWALGQISTVHWRIHKPPDFTLLWRCGGLLRTILDFCLEDHRVNYET